MPIPLHQHLKRGLEHELYDVEPFEEDAETAESHLAPEERAAKRRRVELIATQYLKGSPPFILSAQLRGPFDEGWKNPWAKKRRRANGNRCSQASNMQEEHEISVRQASSRPSPEGTRATVAILNYQTQSTAGQSHITATHVALKTQSKEPSGESEYFSANAEPDATVRELDDSPVWLKHPASSRIRRDSYPHPSPTPTRHGNVPIDSHGKIRLASPKASINRGSTLSKSRPPVPDAHWRSSASTSMDISSPVKPSKPIGIRPSPVISKSTQETSHRKVPESQINTGNTSGHKQSERQIIAHYEQPSSMGIEQGTRTAVKGGGKGTQSVNLASNPGITMASLPGKGKSKGPSREEVRSSAERCVANSTVTNTLTKNSGKKAKKAHGHGLSDHGPKLVASPAPNSSMGFEYQKIQRVKAGKRPAPKKDPKPANLRSPPKAIREGEVLLAGTAPPVAAMLTDSRSEAQRVESVQHEKPNSMPPNHLDVYDIRTIEKEHSNTASNRHSMYSTQAAMLLAQLEFQEGSFLSTSSETPRTLLVQEENGRSRPESDEPSNAAITPFHAFNAELDKSRPKDDLPAEVPISTQDLFNAASPFPFSTLKRKTARTGRSSLRFAVHPSPPGGNEESANAQNPRSPSPSVERKLLKERNAKVSLGTNVTGSEKGSQDPPLSPADSPTSPKIGNLLDDVNLDTSLSFTSHFMRDINAIT